MYKAKKVQNYSFTQLKTVVRGSLQAAAVSDTSAGF